MKSVKNQNTSSLFLIQEEIGQMKNYIYLIGDKQTKEVAIVDPAWNVSKIIGIIKKNELKLKAIFITHGHKDHTNGIDEVLLDYDIPVYVSKHEASLYKPLGSNIKQVDNNFDIHFGTTKIEFLHTPGHTPGSQCFKVNQHLIAGDTLFLDGCGRCDLPMGNVEVMYDTIYKKLMKLPNNTIIYPGHNYHHCKNDTLENQKITNPYMNCSHLQSFIQLRMNKIKI